VILRHVSVHAWMGEGNFLHDVKAKLRFYRLLKDFNLIQTNILSKQECKSSEIVPHVVVRVVVECRKWGVRGGIDVGLDFVLL
jgi:hypothetical protein